MLVLKFGGTSVGNADMIEKTLNIAQSVLSKSPVLVSSAMTTVTDKLVSVSKYANAGNLAEAQDLLLGIEESHLKVARELLDKHDQLLGDCTSALRKLTTDLSAMVKGLCLIREVSARSYDMLLSLGERLSTLLLYYRARAKGISVSLLDAREFIKTDDQFGCAQLKKDLSYPLIRQKVVSKPGHLIITQGFLGSTEHGVTTTLGRGGSDYSATIIGAALAAESVEIWTDVDGIMTTDPRIISHARVLPEISYGEAAELAFFGAKVIHPSTIVPAVELGIPVWVKNTHRPQLSGTCISSDKDQDSQRQGPLAIAGKKNITLITVRSTRMLNASGFLDSIFSVFEKYKVSVDLIATSEVCVSVTVDNLQHIKSLKHDLEKFSELSIESELAIVSVVGRNLYSSNDFLLKVFSALQAIPVRLITMGASDINLSLVVAQSALNAAIEALHKNIL